MNIEKNLRMDTTQEQAYARELREWLNHLIQLECPAISEDEDLTFKIGYLYHDGTIAYTGRRGDKKFSMVYRWAQSIPLLEKICMKFPIKDSDPRDTYVAISYQDACTMKKRLEETEFVKRLILLHKNFHDFIQDKHTPNLVHTDVPFVEVYSDGEMITHTGFQFQFPVFGPDTFYFPQDKTGTTGIQYSSAIIPYEFREEVIGKIKEILRFIRSVRIEYESLASEYA